MKTILLAIDSFKECISSRELSTALAHAISELFPHYTPIIIPIADGGEGTVDAIASTIGEGRITRVTVDTTNALGEPITAKYITAGDTAYIDVATATGLALISPSRRNPLVASSRGTGVLIAHALTHGARHILLGVGGSVTNDAGMGILHELGIRFTDSSGNTLSPSGEALQHVCGCDTSTQLKQLTGATITILADVDNPFSGINGAAHTFAPQKGALPGDVEILDRGLNRFNQLAIELCGIDLNTVAGAGAAGGIAGGLIAYTGATIRSGIDYILDCYNFDTLAAQASLIVTGEGRLDSQSIHGKVVSGIARRAIALGIPVIAIAGTISPDFAPEALSLTAALCINQPGVPLAEALRPATAKANATTTLLSYLARCEDGEAH